MSSRAPPDSESVLSPEISWQTVPPERALTLLDASPEGLSDDDVLRRRRTSGENRLSTTQRVSALRLLADQLRSVVVLLLFAAAALAVLTGDYIEALAIACVLFLNTMLGWVVELRARRSMEALLDSAQILVTAIRAGTPRRINAVELVAGDIIVLEAGDAVAADARLLTSVELHVNEASLTGESLPVAKTAAWNGTPDTPLPDRRNCVYTGTHIVTGSARAVVFAIGDATELGRIGRLVGQIGSARTPLERRLDALGRRFVWLTMAVTAVVLAIGLLQGIALPIMLESSIALAIAAVPEGLPAVATIALAVGLRRMARRNAVVRKLHAVEALGSATVVCTDKTGTLTANQMTVTQLQFVDGVITVTGDGYAPTGEFLLDSEAAPTSMPQLVAALAVARRTARAQVVLDGGRWRAEGDPTDAALHAFARKAPPAEEAGTTATGISLPFSSERQYSAEIVHDGTALNAFIKGAPQRVLELCSAVLASTGPRALDATLRTGILQANDAMASQGLRVIALAAGNPAEASDTALRDLTWIGLAGIIDAPATGVKDTIAMFRTAGIRTVMITGDQRLTANAIARQLGITDSSDETLDGAELRRLADDELRRSVRAHSVYSRTSPDDKFAIVNALQSNGEIVAMLGDGVNDAAALKKADISVAMGVRGTDVAKSVSDVVLQDDRFSTIGAAIEEGRVIYDNIRKFIFYLFSCNLAEVLVLFAAGAAGMALPAAPLQILWLNLVTDTFPALALAFEPREHDIMSRPPLRPDTEILSRNFLRATAFHATLISLVTIAAFLSGTLVLDPGHAMTMAFMTLALAQTAHLGTARSKHSVVSPARAFANPYAVAAVTIVIALQLAAVYVEPLAAVLHTQRLTYIEWLVVALCAALPAVVGQLLHSRQRPPASDVAF
jgi:Ca2+-transporting ATPase